MLIRRQMCLFLCSVFACLTYSVAFTTACERFCSAFTCVWFGWNGLDTSTVQTKARKRADFLPDFSACILVICNLADI